MARDIGGGRGDAWKDDLAKFLRQSDAYQVLGSGNGDDAAGEAHTAGGEAEEKYPLGDLIKAHYREYSDYVLPIGYRAAESGERSAGSYALYMAGIAIPDPRVQKVAVVLSTGAHFLMMRPKDPEEQRAFLVDFMPGGHPVILGEQDEEEVHLPPHRQILAEAMYDPEAVPTSDTDFEAVMEAITHTGKYREHWGKEEARRVAQLALAFSQVQRPEESDEQ